MYSFEDTYLTWVGQTILSTTAVRHDTMKTHCNKKPTVLLVYDVTDLLFKCF